MNPRHAVPARSVPKPKPEALFAAEVYADDEEGTAAPKRAIDDELAQLRTELRGEARALRRALSRPAKIPAELLAELATLRGTVDELLAAPKKGDAALSAIRARGIEGAAASLLARHAKSADKSGRSDRSDRSDKGDRSSSRDIVEKLRAACASFIRIAEAPLPSPSEGRTLIALVGPAGVGKTTTAAKLAAHARMARKTVALVSCDAFRVGAMDQLGKYAELMDARFYTATSQEELSEIVRREDADVIIIDTSGRAIEPDATEAQLGASDLRSTIERTGRRIEVLLCVPASLRASDATRVHRDFARAMPTALTITKLDETDTPAGIAHAVFATRLPVSTLCAGQCVPEDIAPASAEAIADLLFPNASTKDAHGR